jgi:hypothetical protein
VQFPEGDRRKLLEMEEQGYSEVYLFTVKLEPEIAVTYSGRQHFMVRAWVGFGAAMICADNQEDTAV